MTSCGYAYVDIDEVAEDLERLKAMNRRLLKELQNEEFRGGRNISSGLARIKYALGAIEYNKEQIARLEIEILQYRSKLINVRTCDSFLRR